jgi:peptidoglycan/LPS O-acetylase OafA/YrhL
MMTGNSRLPSESPQRIPGLDGIRGCAFLLVIFGHSGFKWIPNGFGVTVFFFLSGYLITTLLRREFIRSGSISISQFYIRRAFRILPPLYCGIALSVSAALIGFTTSAVRWKSVATILLFLTNYEEALLHYTVPVGLSVLWSLAVEEHFYLLFPVGYKFLRKWSINRLHQVSALLLICGAVLAWRIVLMDGYHVFWNRVYTGTDTRLDSILFGCILAIGFNPVIDNVDCLSRRQWTVAGWLAFAVLTASIAMRGEPFRQTFRYSIQGLALMPIFVYVIRFPDSAITRIFDTKALVHIGDLSYALYVVHYTVMFAVQKWITVDPFLTVTITLSVSYVIARIIRILVENPFARMRDRVLAKEQQRVLTARRSPVPNSSTEDVALRLIS